MGYDRKKIRNLFGGKCAYCGCTIGKVFHADHVKPLFRGYTTPPPWSGKDQEDNLFPACPRCNLRKQTNSVEEFRKEIESQLERLNRDSASFRLARDFSLITENKISVQFWFEKYEK